MQYSFHVGFATFVQEVEKRLVRWKSGAGTMSYRAFTQCILGSALVLLLATSGRAAPLIVTLVAPTEAVAPGSGMAVSLLAVNSGDTTMSFNPPARLDATLRQGNLAWVVQLSALRQGGVRIAPHGFAKLDYVFTLPAAAQGELILEAGSGLAHPVVAMLTATAARGGAIPAESGRAETSVPYSVASLSTQPATSLMARSFIDHISPNDPVYFVYGPKAPAAKFQFSLKYRLFTFDSEANSQYDSTVQFGYTQRSLWDVTSHPESLYDTSYMPSFFYQFLSPSPNPTGGTEITWLGFAAGYQHESNGQGGTLERSLNTLYARTGVMIGRTDRWHAVVTARGLTYVGGLADNPALKNYRGYGDWGLTVAYGSGPSLSYTGWAGKSFNHGTTQLDLNVPVSLKFLDFQMFVLAQYFNGYGEALRTYQAHSNVLRGGISLVR